MIYEKSCGAVVYRLENGCPLYLIERMALHTAIRRLPEREQKLIALRYFKGLTQVKTAQILGISQVQVSRLEKKSIAFLRWQLEGG